jgi:hypothetical protein
MRPRVVAAAVHKQKQKGILSTAEIASHDRNLHEHGIIVHTMTLKISVVLVLHLR